MTVTETDDWRSEAACLEAGVEMQPDRATEAEVAAALAVCRLCHVRDECRALAESQAEAYGVHDGEWFGEAPVVVVERECEHCGQEFRRERAAGRLPRFCSDDCREAARVARQAEARAARREQRPEPAKPSGCGQCGKPARRKFCSELCSNAARRNRARAGKVSA